jgi:hypothetical protein
MHTEPIPGPAPADSDTPLPPPSTSPAKEKTMEPHHERFKPFWLRPALFAAAMGMSATLLLSVCSAFYIVSSEPVLVDTPEARSAVAGCDALGNRMARKGCVRHLVARASAQDAGTSSQLAAIAPRRHGTVR